MTNVAEYNKIIVENYDKILTTKKWPRIFVIEIFIFTLLNSLGCCWFFLSIICFTRKLNLNTKASIFQTILQIELDWTKFKKKILWIFTNLIENDDCKIHHLLILLNFRHGLTVMKWFNDSHQPTRQLPKNWVLKSLLFLKWHMKSSISVICETSPHHSVVFVVDF